MPGTLTVIDNQTVIRVGENTAEATRQATRAAASAAYAEAMVGPTYADTATGLANTIDGEGFAVDNGDGTVTVYQNVAGVAVSQRTLATTAYSEATYAKGSDLASTAIGEGGSLIGYKQSGAGAVDRTVTDKLGDASISVKDFGAVGDGSTDDTAAIQAAINASATLLDGRVYLPAGDYVTTGTLYFHYDAILNPNFPTGENHRNGRISLIGARAVDQPQLRFNNGPNGSVIRYTGTSGSAIVWGNGSGADATTTRRVELRDFSIVGDTSGDLLDLNGAGQSPLIQNVCVVNDGANVTASSSAVRTRNGLYAGRLVNMHVMGGAGRGMRVESGSMVEFNTVNVTNSVLGWDIGNDPADLDDSGFGTATTFINCQARNGTNGVEVRGGRNLTFIGWWIEQNTGDFDMKLHGNVSHVTLENLYFTSTALSVGSLVCGGNSGTAANDRARHVKVRNCTFGFCGPTSAQAGVVKYGGCDYLEVDGASFKSNGGRGFIIDTSNGVTPTILKDIDWDPPGAGAAFGTNSKVVDQAGASSPWLTRGMDFAGIITADLDMSTWTHLPDVLTATTSGGNINVTLPTDVSKFIGQDLMVRKSIAGNTLTLTGSINNVASISVTAANAMPSVKALGGGRYGQLA